MHAYLAAPMSGVEHGNFPAIRAAARDLRQRGIDVTSPVELNDADGEKGALEIGHPRRPEYMLRDFAHIAAPDVDAVVVLDGWEGSPGAVAEVAFARALGKPVLRYPDLEPLAHRPVRHPLSARFHEVLGELGDLHDLKQEDYGSDADPFANVRGTADWGIAGWEGAMIRATDKVHRLMSYARRGRLSNEGVIDSFNDLAVYAIIARVLFEEESGQG
jgi:nucleoside 2-deoxyribosyltransferase